MKQDRNGVRTAQDLERKYNLSSISLIKKAVEQTETGLTKVNAELENFANATLNTIEDLQNQIDGNITTYYYSGVPTLSNLPVSSWSQSEYNVHIGDLYYDKNTGYAYRFYLDSTTNQYGWVKLTDNDVVQALAIANAASDTADSKRRVFTETPTPPYDNGDLWINNQEIYICQISKDSTQQYSSDDFIVATKYTDNTLANQVNERLTVVSGRVTTVEQGVDELSTQIEENRYYIDDNGNRVLISEQVNRVTSNVNGITQRINNLSIFIREATSDEQVFIENASAHTLMHLSITGAFELLYPNSSLYPSSNIYPLSPYLVVENIPEAGEELKRKIYTLPIDKIETGDTFEIDLEGNCTLTKQDDSIIDLGILNVELFEGDNYLYIPSYHPELLNYHVNYVIKNEYTSVFATRIETHSAITQTADEINLEVSKKVDENDVVSTINQSAEKIELRANRLIVDSDNFKLSEEGNIEAVSGDIGGFILNPTSFSKDINGLYKYNEYDMNLAAMIVMNRISLRDNIKQILDANGDDEISSADYARIKNIINELVENTKNVSGHFEINSNDPKRCLIIKSNSGDEVLSMGLGGLNSSYVACKNIVCGETGSSINDWSGVTVNGDTGAIRCVSLEQTSLKEMKKNFEKLENALDIIKNTDIYKFNYKVEFDDNKKHIGFVIGDNYKYSKEITNNSNDGVDLYSMVSVCFKAIKEQEQKINQLEKKIKRMESD